MEKQHLEELLDFIREHRSNEANFNKIYARLEDEINAPGNDGKYLESLQEIKEKQVEEYLQSKKEGTTAWPEFEKFISEFEKTIAGNLKLP